MSDYLSKLIYLSHQLNLPAVSAQTKEVKTLVQDLNTKTVPVQAPRKLGFAPDRLEQMDGNLTADQRKKLRLVNHLLNSVRQFLSLRYGTWSIPNLQTAKLIKSKLRVHHSLEIMAGNGYWSLALKRAGLKTIATDSFTWAKTSATGAKNLFLVHDLPAEQAIRTYKQADLIICSWAPNFGHSDWAAVQSWRRYNPAAHLLFVGEKNGVTNSPLFWQKAHFLPSPALKAINASFTSFDFINEQIFEIR